MFRTTRALAAFAALAGLVLGLLVCGTAASASSATSASPALSTAPALSAAPVLGAVVPGCDPGHAADAGASGPVVPPRPGGFAELLPALAADRTPSPARHGEPDGRGTAPGREPPERVAPSPVELSTLMRV
ncbi:MULTISPECIES: hypothetical protein [Streptomyces]|uniref:Secreted protein n=1 Tax=Streptomyces venezuelae TaxID=54571 RepID=A0A5P2AXK6_STRVZ|nr:hypothetical protein [Streptomyces venezuelae]QES20899.1 hypothetical protein DEJ46_18735 [Streptomyces venezuelae]